MLTFDEQLRDWWDKYYVAGDPEIRSRLVMALSPIVMHVVEHHSRDAPAWRSLDALTRVGLAELIGLLDDYEHCDVTLEHYAWIRVNRAVIDDLRRARRAPRLRQVAPDLLRAGA